MRSTTRWKTVLPLVWAIAVVPSGAWLGHWSFQASRALAEVADRKWINGPVNWLGGHAADIPFPLAHALGIVCAGLLGALPFASALWRGDGGLRDELAALARDRAGGVSALWAATGGALLSLLSGFPASVTPKPWVWTVLSSIVLAAGIELVWRGAYRNLVATGSSRVPSGILTTASYLLVMIAIAPPTVDSWDPGLASVRYPIWPAIGNACLPPGCWVQLFPLALIGSLAFLLRCLLPSLWMAIGLQSGYWIAVRLGVDPLHAALAVSIVAIGLVLLRKPTAFPPT